MHVDYHIVDPMQYVKQAFIQQNVFVYLVIQEILELHAINVSVLLLIFSFKLMFRK